MVLSGTELDRMPRQEFIGCYHPKCFEAGQERWGGGLWEGESICSVSNPTLAVFSSQPLPQWGWSLRPRCAEVLAVNL